MDRLNAMEALIRVVDAGSFSEAAKRWGRSKAAVSKYVAALEEHVGVQLLQRTTRSSSLTEAGRLYVAGCRELLGDLDALEAGLHTDRVALRGLLRVSAPPGLASRHLHALTTDFLAQHPDMRIDLDLTHRIVDMVDEGVDVAIRATEPLDSSLVARRLAPVHILAVAAPAYLDAHGALRTPADLAHHRCLVDSNFREPQRWRFCVEGRRVSVRVDAAIRVNSPIAIRELCLDAQCVALAPDFMVEDELRAGKLVELFHGQVALEWTLHALYMRRDHVPARLRAYVDHLALSFSANVSAGG